MHGSHLRHNTLHVEVLLEQDLVVRLLLQIDFDEVFELFTQMPDGCRFSYLSGTSKQHGFMGGTCCPFTKILIYDSFVIHLRYEFSRCKDAIEREQRERVLICRAGAFSRQFCRKDTKKK